MNLKSAATCVLVVWISVGTGCGDSDGSGAATSNSDATSNGTGTGDGSMTNNSSSATNNGAATSNGTGSSNSTGGGMTAPEGCLADLFVEPAADPANTAYPDPRLNAYCEGDELVVESNGIIGYPFVPLTPNPLSAQDYTWRVPIEPQYMDTPTDIPLLGVAGFSVNGLPFYGPNEAEMPDPFGDPVYNGIVDMCQGHTAQRGDYHYHALLVDCITPERVEGEPDPIIAIALDGFPIYGSVGCVDAECSSLVTHRSGWVQTGDPTTYAWDNHQYMEQDDPAVLDACNGHFDSDGNYHYHATETFPYILGCYHGAVDGMAGGGNMGGGDETCTTSDDCASECTAALGCACEETPMGNACLERCEEDDDCGEEMTCSPSGLCRRVRM
ncbi:MAG: YHYH protein [Myxococcota bacterium]